MNLASNQYAAAQYTVYHPCFTGVVACASAQSGQQMLSSEEEHQKLFPSQGHTA